MMKEQWKPMSINPDYEVSNFGRIRRHKSTYYSPERLSRLQDNRHQSKISFDRKGYYYPMLFLGNNGSMQLYCMISVPGYKQIKIRVKREVVKAFVPRLPKEFNVECISKDKANCRLDNLMVVAAHKAVMPDSLAYYKMREA